MPVSHRAINELIIRLKSEGYTCPSDLTAFTGMYKTKLTWVCPKGHEFLSTGANLKYSGVKCSVCFGTPKKSDAEIASMFSAASYELLEPYKRTDTKHLVRCPEGHEYQVTPTKFRTGRRCPHCVGNAPLGLESARTELKKWGFELLETKPFTSKSPIKLRCLKNHEVVMIYNNVQQKHGCFYCSQSKQYSKPELEIKELLENNGLTALHRSKVMGVELDLLLPDQKLAIEYCGLYWHAYETLLNRLERRGSKKPIKDIKAHHLTKKKLCDANNIKLITIFEDEWLWKKDLVMAGILAKANIYHEP